MSEPVERICKNCLKEYSNYYSNVGGYEYTFPTDFCSKSCATKHRLNTNPGCIKKDRGREVLHCEAVTAITEAGRYLTTSELTSAIGCSSKTLTKHGIKVSAVNQEAGFNKPKSAFQDKVGSILMGKFPSLENEKTFPGLTGKKGHPLRVDFYIPEKNVVVEADGSQHKDQNHPWASHPNGTVQEYDEIKNNYFKENDIKVVRIPYRKRLTEKHVLSDLDI